MHSSQIAIAVASLACVCDLRTRRIPNVLTFGAAIIAFALHGLVGGRPELMASAGGWLLGVALFFPFFALGGLGAGDVKLLGAIGAWLGPAAVLYVAFFSTLAGGVLALIVALRAGYVRQAVRNLGFLLRFWSTVGFRPAEGLTLEKTDSPRLAYAVPVLAGLLVTLWVR